MPRIPVYDAYGPIQGPVSVSQATPDDFGAGVGRAITGAGAELQREAERARQVLERKKAREAQTWVDQSIADGRLQFIARQQELEQSAPLGAGGHTDALIGEIDAWQQDAMEKAPSPESRDAFRVASDRMKATFLGTAGAFEIASSAKYRRAAAEHSFDAMRNAITASPLHLDDSLDQMRAMVAEMPIPEALQFDLTKQQAEAFHAAAADGMTRQIKSSSAAAALEAEFRDNTMWQENLDPRNYAQVLSRLATRREQLEAKESAEWTAGFRDEVAAMAVQGDRGQFTEAEIRANVADADDARKMIAERRHAAALGEQRQWVNTATPDEINRRAQQLRATVDDRSAASTDVTSAAKQLAALGEAVRARQTALQKDPVGYVLENSTVAAEAYDALQAAPGDAAVIREYAATVRGEQRRLGVPAENAVLLPKVYVDKIAHDVAQVATAEDGAERVLGITQGLRETWGSDWPTVYRQLVAGDALTGVHAVAARLPIERMGVAVQLVAAQSVGRKAMEDLLPDATMKEGLTAATRIATEQMAAVYGEHLGGVTVVRDHQASINLLALRYLTTGQEASADAAVERAYNDLFGADFNIVDRMMIPVDYDADMIPAGAQRLLNEQVAKLPLVVPASLLGLNPDVTREVATEQLLGTDGHYWLTRPDGNGVVLMWGGMQRTPVEFEVGLERKRVTFTWSELQSAAAAVEGLLHEAMP